MLRATEQVMQWMTCYKAAVLPCDLEVSGQSHLRRDCV